MPDINGARSSSAGDQNDRRHANGSQPTISDQYVPKKLKSMSWYWGSISPSFATQLLEHEEGGTFLIRDSSSECYIFSMTVKMQDQVHHVRIDHCKGQFSFGRSQKFICKTIIEFVEQALEQNNSGQLLFFLHREPWLEGPARIEMKPLSRFSIRRNQSSLKHMCRAAILPYLRRDKIRDLTLPQILKSFLLDPFIIH